MRKVWNKSTGQRKRTQLVKWLCRSHQGAAAATSFAPLRSDMLCCYCTSSHRKLHHLTILAKWKYAKNKVRPDGRQLTRSGYHQHHVTVTWAHLSASPKYISIFIFHLSKFLAGWEYHRGTPCNCYLMPFHHFLCVYSLNLSLIPPGSDVFCLISLCCCVVACSHR